MSGGRPSEFSDEIAKEICARLAKGESLRSICADQTGGWLPGQTTVYRWLDQNETFRKQYAHAREMQAEHFVDEIIEIADSPNASVDANGQAILRDPQRDRLRVEARKWVASKLAPKKYGDRVVQEHTGLDGGPIQVVTGVPRADD